MEFEEKGGKNLPRLFTTTTYNGNSSVAYSQDKKFTLTTEQKRILNEVTEKTGIFKINAFAGTGKTTILLELAKRLSKQGKNGLYIAFNRAVKNEVQEKIKKVKINNLDVKTTHGLAYMYLFGIYRMGMQSPIGQYRIFEMADILNCDFSTALDVADMLKRFFISDKTFLIEIAENTKESKLVDLGNEFIEKMISGEIHTTHDFYLKLFELRLKKESIKVKHYDYIMLDEAQDTNDVTLSIFNHLKAERKIMVGDKHQQIYAFRGAVNIMDKVKTQNILYLTNSFRFEQETADIASTFLSLFKNEKKKLYGIAKYEDSERETEAYLTRTNAKLIEVMHNFEDRDFITLRNPDEIFKCIDSIIYTNEYEDKKVKPEYRFLIRIRDNSDDFFKALSRYADESDDVEIQTSLKVLDEYPVWKIREIKETAKKNYEKNKGKKCTVLSTIHAAKGLEWDKVTVNFLILKAIKKYYLRYLIFLSSVKRVRGVSVPNNVISAIHYLFYKEKNNEIIRSLENELNLYYIAITRAKKFVDFHEDDEFFTLYLEHKNNPEVLKQEVNKVLVNEISKGWTEIINDEAAKIAAEEEDDGIPF